MSGVRSRMKPCPTARSYRKPASCSLPLPLHPVETATTVRVREGKTSTTDGPFAETKEQLGGFLMIDVPDLNDAIRVAAQFPAARFGSVEVRPMKELGCAD